MKSRILMFSIVLGLIPSAVCLAQGNNVRNIFFDTIGGGFQPTKIGVDNMQYIGDQYITAADSTLMQFTTRIVQNDVEFYADFELVPVDTFYLRVYEIAELDILGWQRLGAAYVVKLDAEFPGPNLRVRWRLFDTARNQQIAKGNLEQVKSQWRELGHDVANELVRTLTGEAGIFRTRILYMKRVGDGKELFMADYDGANEKQLTKTATINISPIFSPDGQTVYFVSFLKGDPQLFKVDVGGGKMSQVTNFAGMAAAPAVSPDGNKIACVLTKDGNSEIYVLDLDGRVIKRLTDHRAIDTSPTWSPDGRLIAFSSDRAGHPQVYIMDADGFNVRRLTYEGGYNDSPVWSARSDRITFVSRTKSGRFDIASIDTSGHDYRILTEVGMNENPHFSPDGKHIIFSSSRLGPIDVYMMDITGRSQRRVTQSGGCSNPIWGPLR
ncbi:MAG TPA: Tol-Pal system beta propeller repeat protein TolB [Candidatus Deferrimicrobium sp.]|nr:Tol-Pal system beta propeller repeat protein TolB [Candidatus Deferrimicrobium sp.]